VNGKETLDYIVELIQIWM